MINCVEEAKIRRSYKHLSFSKLNDYKNILIGSEAVDILIAISGKVKNVKKVQEQDKKHDKNNIILMIREM